MTREVRLASGDLEVVILPDVGARIHRLRAFGHDLLRTPDDPAAHAMDPFFWGAYVMAPWCNRVRAEPFEIAGRRIDLAPNFRDGTAIHGLVYDRAWDVHGDDRFSIRADGGDDWPWAFAATLRASVDGSALVLAFELTNLDDGSMPGGLGLHPWLRAPVEVELPAASVYPSNSDPPERPRAANGRHDLRRQAPPPAGLDATWTDLAEPEVALAWPSLGIRGRLLVEAPAPHVAVASPKSIAAVAVEPQTHGPWGLDRLRAGEPGAAALLEPGASLRLRLRLELSTDERIGR